MLVSTKCPADSKRRAREIWVVPREFFLPSHCGREVFVCRKPIFDIRTSINEYPISNYGGTNARKIE